MGQFAKLFSESAKRLKGEPGEGIAKPDWMEESKYGKTGKTPFPYQRGGQIRVIGMPNITRKKKRKCKSCKRK